MRTVVAAARSVVRVSAFILAKCLNSSACECLLENDPLLALGARDTVTTSRYVTEGQERLGWAPSKKFCDTWRDRRGVDSEHLG